MRRAACALLGALLMVQAAFTRDRAIAGLDLPLLQLAFYHPELADPLVIAPVAIADPVTYYFGYKEARLLRVDAVQLAASDRAGRPQANRFSFEIADFIEGDTAPIIRSWLGQFRVRALRRVEIVAWLISDRDRRALADPVIVFRGRIDEYAGLDQYRVKIDCLSWITQRLDQPVLTTTVGDLFAHAPAETRDLVLPLAIGRLSDEGSAEAAPEIVEDEAGRGSSIDGDEPVAGYGDLAVAAPTGLAAGFAPGAGNLAAGSVIGSRFYIWATRVVGGVEGDPYPFLPINALAVDIAGADAAIDATCDDDGADTYRFYIGSYFAGSVRASHYLETDDPVTGVRFTDHPTLESQLSTPITAGGVFAVNAYAYVSVLAVLSEGGTTRRTALAGDVFVPSVGHLRPNRFAWTPLVPSGGGSLLRYEVYWREHPGATYARRFDVDPSQTNSNGDVYWEYDWSASGFTTVSGVPVPVGMVPPRYCGTFTSLDGFAAWGGFCLSVRPGAAFEAAYIGGFRITEDMYGGQIVAPGKTGYTAAFGSDPFYTVGDYRLFMVFLRGPLLEAALGAQQDPETLPATRASATVGEADSAVLIEIDAEGEAGNAYTVEVVAGVGTDVPLSAVLTDQALVVTLATDGAGDPDDAANTGTKVAQAIAAIAGLRAGVTGTGEDPVDVLPTTHFSGGADQGQAPGNPYHGEFRVNFSGCDDADDGTGDVIADRFDQLRLLAKHLLCADAPSVAGAWDGSMPTFIDGSDRVDDDAFDQAQADHDDAIASDRTGARWLADGALTWGELLADWALSAGATTFINEGGAVAVAVANPNAAPVATVDHRLDILDRSFSFRDSAQGFATRTPFSCRPSYSADGSVTFTVADEIIADDAEDEFDESPADDEQPYTWIGDETIAQALAQATNAQTQRPARTVEAASVLHWWHFPIGRVIALTHPEAPGAEGYSSQLLQIVGKRLQPDACTVALTCLELPPVSDALLVAGGLMNDMTLGGSRHASCLNDGSDDVPFDWRPVKFNWDLLPSSYELVFDVEVATVAGTVTPTLAETGGTTAVAGGTGTSHNTDTFDRQQLVVTRTTGVKEYWMLPVIGGGAVIGDVRMFGCLRVRKIGSE